MKLLPILLLTSLLLGCSSDSFSQEERNKRLVKYEDKENGVICYKTRFGYSVLSCVKIK